MNFSLAAFSCTELFFRHRAMSCMISDYYTQVVMDSFVVLAHFVSSFVTGIW